MAEGRGGFLFDAPGAYLVRATYLADDGWSRCSPRWRRLRVRPPASREDEEVGELLLDEEQTGPGAPHPCGRSLDVDVRDVGVREIVGRRG